MKKGPKIAFMTSLGVNVGDEFIREGICSFLDEIFETWDPFYVNKVDLLSLHQSLEDEATVLEDKFRDADIIIQAGAPVYWKIGENSSYTVEWAEELWQKRIFQLGPEKPIFNIAAGACQPYPDFAKTFLSDPACIQFAKDVRSACRWISVRDPLASQILYALGLEHDVLPCTAFYASRRSKFLGSYGQVIGINLMPFAGHYKLKEDIDEGAWRATIEAFLSPLRKHHTLFFIAHDPYEKEFMKSFLAPGEVIFHSLHWRDYLPVYAKCSAIMASRVHGAVCAAGFGRPAVIVGNDTRLLIGDYIGIPSLYVSKAKAEEVVDLMERGIAMQHTERDRLLTLREESANRYRNAILEGLEKFSAPVDLRERSNHEHFKKQKILSLSSLSDLSSKSFQNFMKTINCFAQRWGLRQFTNWSKIWEYPWVWFHGLSKVDWKDFPLLDIGSELSPMPWFLASLGANVTLTETDSQWVPQWERIRDETGLDVTWQIVSGENLPFENESFDVVTSFSAIEHQRDKKTAMGEVIRVLKPGGLLTISFDICEPEMGMTFPDWNGKALTMAQFEDLVWNRPEFDNGGQKPGWNLRDIPEFIKWHLQSAPHHNYVVGAAVLKKRRS
jgi:2-polyprenyl-3-methyl-5-hydroxy-6-metoxy-1,4-benzoquinol methylase